MKFSVVSQGEEDVDGLELHGRGRRPETGGKSRSALVCHGESRLSCLPSSAYPCYFALFLKTPTVSYIERVVIDQAAHFVQS